jgi:hypothetical protein
VQAVNSDLANIISNLTSATSVLSNVTASTGCTLSSVDVTMIINNLNTVKSIVATLESTLTNAVATLSVGKLNSFDG